MQVQLVDLVKDFGQTVAVDHVNLTIKDGALTGLLGPSGCGKSTTLYMISGLEQPTSGKILFDGEDVTEVPAEERGIGLVFQNYALYPHMTVQQNIMFPLVNAKVKKEEALARCMEMAKLVKVDDLLKRKPSQLSGGQQQRVAIAGRWSSSRRFCCWTNRCPIWTRVCVWKCVKKFAAFRKKPASRRFS